MRASYFSTDVQEFIRTLAKHDVRCVIVGGEAVVYHGHARVTNGIDFFYEPTLENAEKLYAALDEYWLGEIPGLKSFEGLLIIDATVQFGDLPNMIVLHNSLTGISFGEAWESKIEESVRIKGKKYPLYFIGLEELVKNKKALKRPIDKEDLKYLKELIKK